MDPHFDDLSFSAEDFNFESYNPSLDPNQSLDIPNGLESNEPAVGVDSFMVPLLSNGLDTSSDMPAISVGYPSGGSALPAEPVGGHLLPIREPRHWFEF